ncbi:MAG: precorrin-6A reductase [Anaerovoracaceae bacterium]
MESWLLLVDIKTSKKRVLVFSGTYEGHKLAEFCQGKGYQIDMCVATEYGEEVISHIEGINILKGRLDTEEIVDLIKEKQYEMVIDATHPYATLVTENIKKACDTASCKYYRLAREEEAINIAGVTEVNTIAEAVEILNQNESNVLLTTGAKELGKYKDISNLEKRVFARVLPSVESINSCKSLGLPSSNIICMQGPFLKEMNLATAKQFNCKYLVTKNTGKPGGLLDKLSCAESGIGIIVIKRPKDEEGNSLGEIKTLLEDYYGK